ncbi:hypothetical protein HPP92_015625 [Vanilla planifolia]|uniref:Uncharacterized protein n=1 Tax=Vanilla planifolia TaxID=51239 RepID=A0A835QEN2_VANPL|nr:hypothetical protein HPP92_016446 [Vanilla planifolia]KAG0471079.1 hypothetical protein HPP92_015625 [Vanilla planifolia]
MNPTASNPTFPKLEPQSSALSPMVCAPLAVHCRRFYCVGPTNNKGNIALRHQSLSWLDGQPNGSVVFLCFGSAGSSRRRRSRRLPPGWSVAGRISLW